jgi:hypothetical protein
MFAAGTVFGDFRHWKDHDASKASAERDLRDLKRVAQ